MNTLNLDDFALLLTVKDIRNTKEISEIVFGGGGVIGTQQDPIID